MTDEPDTRELENRIDKLESTIEKMMPSRRDALKMGGAALVGGAAMSGTASAGTNQVGTIGSASQLVDIESEDINNADTVTTQDLVVNGTATGPFGSDLQGCRVFLSSDQNISQGTRAKIQFDTAVYDSDNNFDFTNHNFTCPQTGVYSVNLHIQFVGGGDRQQRQAQIGTDTAAISDNEGAFNLKRFSFFDDTLTPSTLNKYSQGEAIAAYAGNFDSADTLLSGTENFATFLEVVFLGSI